MKKIIGLIILGSSLWSITMIKSGWLYTFGLGFWGANGHDGIWHIALANSLSKLSFDNPVFSGQLLQNYHLGFDIFLALFHKFTFVPISILYFQVLPPITAILIGLLVYIFVNLWTGSKKSALLSTIFVYFGGSAGWLLSKGESTFWAQQSISTLINPPYSFSLVLILIGLIALLKKKIVLSILFFGILIQIKAYAAVLVLAGLFIAAIYEWILNRKTTVLKVFLGSFLINFVLFNQTKIDGFSIFSWQPFWFLETMMSYSDRLGWDRFYSAMTTYKMGNIWFKEIGAYLVALLIFIVGNFWTRLVFLKDIFKKIDAFKILFLIIISLGTLIPLFFVQNGTPWNTIQFIYYSIFFSGILAGISLSEMKVDSQYHNWLIFVVIMFTIPTTVISLKDIYIPSRPPAKISVEEYQALNFLRGEPDGIVLNYPFDKYKAQEAENNPPRPLYLYESTSYISAYTNKQSYLEDEVNLNIMGYDWQKRKEELIDWYKLSDPNLANQFLIDNNIKYIYWLKPQRHILGETDLSLLQIFENKEVIIYKYAKDLSSN